MHHLVVTRELPKHKIGALITDPVEIERVLGCAEHRSVVKAFAHLTHAGVAEVAAKAAAEKAEQGRKAERPADVPEQDTPAAPAADAEQVPVEAPATDHAPAA